MPELPEVEVTRRGLLSDLPGRLVTAIRCGRLRLRAPLPAALLRTHIAGQRITTIDRRAKYLLFRMARGAVLSPFGDTITTPSPDKTDSSRHTRRISPSAPFSPA